MYSVRDDDTSYWTTPNILEKIYGEYLCAGNKLSLAVIPCAYQMLFPENRKKFYVGDQRKYINENKELVDFLVPYVRKGQIEIMQHGYDHSYSVMIQGKVTALNFECRKEIGFEKTVLLGECVYKDIHVLKEELYEGKTLLEDTFHTKVKTFVPPSNALTKETVLEIEKLDMNISGTMTAHYNRKKDIYSLRVFIKKMLWKLVGNTCSYPYVMKYQRHKEIVGYSFTPATDYEMFTRIFAQCLKLGCGFTLSTHYWEIDQNEELKKRFEDFISSWASQAESVCVHELFERM